jgi:tRNA(Ile2) C34 agmatinyltransferase TiaS
MKRKCPACGSVRISESQEGFRCNKCGYTHNGNNNKIQAKR